MQAEDIKLTLKQIVESKEVKDLSEQLFKRLDEAALTPNGKIKTYSFVKLTSDRINCLFFL